MVLSYVFKSHADLCFGCWCFVVLYDTGFKFCFVFLHTTSNSELFPEGVKVRVCAAESVRESLLQQYVILRTQVLPVAEQHSH